MSNKQLQRKQAYDARNAQPDKENISHIICNKFLNQHAYHQADTVMWYLHCRSEVQTVKTLVSELDQQKRIVIPYCTNNGKGQKILGLWLLKDLSELNPGTWGILEPPKSRWREQEKLISPEELDLIMVPGVAFDRSGGRLGNGAGYYDRLLQKVRPDAQLTGVCYESQLCDQVIMEKHDITMDKVITEINCYSSKRNGFESSQK